MTDLTAHPLPFGGLALVPVSDAGRDWLATAYFFECVLNDVPVFVSEYQGEDGTPLPGDACMTSFPADAIGFEPQDWPEIVTAARDAGLIVKGAVK